MTGPGPAQGAHLEYRDGLKLTSYTGERQRTGRQFVADALIELYGRHEVAASIMLRGAEGFGLKHHLRSDSSLTLSDDLPIVVMAVDNRAKIEAVLGRAAELSSPGLLTLERVRFLVAGTAATKGRAELGYPELGSSELTEVVKLTVHLSRHERTGGVPAFMAVCDLLHRSGLAGATALLGVDGTAHGHRQRARFFSANADVPMVVVAVGAGERVREALPELAALLRRPFVCLERVLICKRDGQRLASPPTLPGTDEHGMGLWQKLTVYTSEASRHHGAPVYRAITQRLRSSGASGATTVRGIWGFHGDHAPHGDRLLQVGRHVPVVTIVVGSPARIASAFTVVDELTSEGGLVTCETVPAMRTVAGDQQRGGLVLATHHLRPPLAP